MLWVGTPTLTCAAGDYWSLPANTPTPVTNDWNVGATWGSGTVPTNTTDVFLTNNWTVNGHHVMVSTNPAVSVTINSLQTSGGNNNRTSTLFVAGQQFSVLGTGTIGGTYTVTFADTGVGGPVSTGSFSSLVIAGAPATSFRTRALVRGENVLTVSDTLTVGVQGRLDIGSVLDGSRFAVGEIQNLVLTSNGLVNVANGNLLRVFQTATLSDNSLLSIGTVAGSGIATGVFNHLVMQDSATIDFGSDGANGRGPDVLLVTGSFVNAAGNMFQTAAGNGMSLIFQNSAAITNNGSISAFWSDFDGPLGAAFNLRATTGSTTNTFLNKGIIQFGSGWGGTPQPTAGTTWTSRWDVGLVNEGEIYFTNRTRQTGAAVPTTNIVLIGGSHAATNAYTGVISMVVTQVSSGNTTMTLDMRFGGGGFVNEGTLRSAYVGVTGVANKTNYVTVTTGSFSNAATGRVILPTENALQYFAIRSDDNVNHGTNLLQGGTLLYQNASGGPGSLRNAGTIIFDGGTMRVDGFTNTGTGLLTGYGTFTHGQLLLNQGAILASNNATPLVINAAVRNDGVVAATDGQLVIAGVFTNNGQFTSFNSVATFSNAVVNNGSWIIDPSTNTFLGDFTVTEGGTMQGDPGDLFDFKKSFFIHSTNHTGFDLASSWITFSGGGAHTNAVTGGDFGTNALYAGGNFGYGRLTLASPADHLYFLSGGYTNGAATNHALYVSELALYDGASALDANLVTNLHSSFNIYYLLSEHSSFNSYLNDQTYALVGGGFLMPVVPEPSALSLAVAGAVLWMLRTRRTR